MLPSFTGLPLEGNDSPGVDSVSGPKSLQATTHSCSSHSEDPNFSLKHTTSSHQHVFSWIFQVCWAAWVICQFDTDRSFRSGAIVSKWGIRFIGIELLKRTLCGVVYGHQGAVGHHCSDIIYRMATRTGVEDRWAVGVRQLFCDLADPPPSCHLSDGRWGLNGAAAVGSEWLLFFGALGVVSRSTPSNHRSPPTSASIRRKVEVVPLSKKSCSNDLWTLTSHLPPFPFEPPSSLSLYSYTVAMTTMTLHPFAWALHLLSIKWTGTFPLSHLFIHTHSELWFITWTLTYHVLISKSNFKLDD